MSLTSFLVQLPPVRRILTGRPDSQSAWGCELLTADPYPQGVLIGAWRSPLGRLYTLAETELRPVGVLGDERSGKTVGVFAPTLLAWKGSALVMDVRGELLKLTALWRESQGQRIYRFEPADPKASIRINLLDSVRTGTVHEIADSLKLASDILAASRDTDEDQEVLSIAQSLLTGVILHHLHECAAGTASLGSLAHKFENLYLQELILRRNELCGEHEFPWREAVATAAEQMFGLAPEMCDSIVALIKDRLQPYTCSPLKELTCVTDLALHELAGGSCAATLYLIGGLFDQYAPILRLIVSQVLSVRLRSYGALAESEQEPTAGTVPQHRPPMLLMLDDLSRLGVVPSLAEQLAFLRAYGVQVVLGVRGIDQLRFLYGHKAQEIVDRVPVWAVMSVNRLEEGRWVAGRSGGAFTADQVLRLQGPVKERRKIVSAGKMLALVNLGASVCVWQRPYFLDQRLLSRSQAGRS